MDDFGDGFELGENSLGAYVHSPHSAVAEVFSRCDVNATSVVWDIGCGDGRTCLLALEKFQCLRAVGVDVDKDLVDNFRAKAGQRGLVAPRCIALCRDALSLTEQPDLFSELGGPPTHVYIYILQHMLHLLVQLVSRIQREVPRVTVISAFPFPRSTIVTTTSLTASPAEATSKEGGAAEEEASSSDGRNDNAGQLHWNTCFTLPTSGGKLTYHVYREVPT